MYAVADLMTQGVISIEASELVPAAQTLWRQHGTSHLPVTDHGRLVGIITPLDAVQAIASGRAAPMSVRDAMRSPVHQVHPDTSLRAAAETMLERRIGCVVVVDDEDQLVGLLTEADLVRFAIDVIADFDGLAEGLERDAAQGEVLAS
jgi:CBS domain-containing protein